MKRSEINKAVLRALEIMKINNIYLPGFGYWKKEEWLSKLPSLNNIVKIGLGWDVTDFGSGDFFHVGAILFTVRNGDEKDASAGTPYAEKYIVQFHENEQEIPLHFHRKKTEDIINRGGGTLSIQLFNSTPDNQLDKVSRVRVRMDGEDVDFEAGIILDIPRGASITLTPGLFHRFWAKKGDGDLVAGEVSSVNDDFTDNIFLKDQPRFSKIEEDEPVLFPLCNEYESVLR